MRTCHSSNQTHVNAVVLMLLLASMGDAGLLLGCGQEWMRSKSCVACDLVPDAATYSETGLAGRCRALVRESRPYAAGTMPQTRKLRTAAARASVGASSIGQRTQFWFRQAAVPARAGALPRKLMTSVLQELQSLGCRCTGRTSPLIDAAAGSQPRKSRP